MASQAAVVRRLQECRPPATDVFTYLTIVEESLSPDMLPDLNNILQDAELTSDIGWDLVESLLRLPGSEACLETISRLGNPREVILKVLEAMEKSADEVGAETGGVDEAGETMDGGSLATRRFVLLAGMLGVLHKRLKVRSPSKFLETTLQAVCTAYNPRSADETAAVVDLVRSLSSPKRPPLPTRHSSTNLATPFQHSDPSQSAPDPEAEAGEQQPEAEEPARMERMLQAFAATTIEAYVDANDGGWAPRLLEYTYPDRIVPGTMTATMAYREVEALQASDALMGQLATMASDLGLARTAREMMEKVPTGEGCNPPEGIAVSLNGATCLAAYHMFSSEVFDANYELPDMHIFPQHHALLKQFLGDEAQAQIASQPGTAGALVAMAVYLDGRGLLVGPGEGATRAGYMAYLHLLTLVSVFHPDVLVRNAATVVAGHVLHADPDEDDRLTILEDLLENCDFSSLRACAVSWLREEIVAAQGRQAGGRFADAECFDKLQYSLFPDLTPLLDSDAAALAQVWAQNAPFHRQAANFALFLFGGEHRAELVPAGLAAAVEHRYVAPLQHLVRTLTQGGGGSAADDDDDGGEARLPLVMLGDTLARVPLQ